MISLKTRLVLTYGVFICIAVVILSFVTNAFADQLFAQFVRDNIQAQNEVIVDALEEQYNQKYETFNNATLMALGMNYVHQGYIISVEDANGTVIWDARECDMQQCASVINEIEKRMSGEHNLTGQFQINQYSLLSGGQVVGAVNIETYGPYFFSKSESGFIAALNRFLLITGVVFAAVSIAISILIATTLTKPILKAADTAKSIAGGDLSVRISNTHRTKEIFQLSQSVNDLAIALENGDKWQKRLTSDVAHELRTPLTTLQSTMEAMIDGVWEPTKERLESCHEEIGRLSRLVEDLGLVTVLEQESFVLHKKDFDLADVCASVVDQNMPLAIDKNISVHFSPVSAMVYADASRVRQVLLNILSNAVKYTDDGQIEISMITSENEVKVAVSDTGVGISSEDLPYIFDRFYRADKSRNRSSGGSGIGLTIAMAIMQAHHGTITVSSKMGEGTTFVVSIPKKDL